MARAIWKGVIRLGDVRVPVKLFPAVEDRTVHFRLLSKDTLRPVKQRMVNPVTGEVVPYEEVRWGSEFEEGTFVVLGNDELAALEPEGSRDIALTRFVEAGVINHQWYDRPYHLGPDDSTAAYFALAEALEQSGREGVARWSMRKKEYVGALRPESGHLMLITLRHEGEVIPVSALEAPRGRKPTVRELNMAEQLVAALEDTFDPVAFHDEYRERVLALVHAKAEGKAVEFRRPSRRRAAGDLAATLKASIAAAKKERKSA